MNAAFKRPLVLLDARPIDEIEDGADVHELFRHRVLQLEDVRPTSTHLVLGGRERAQGVVNALDHQIGQLVLFGPLPDPAPLVGELAEGCERVVELGRGRGEGFAPAGELLAGFLPLVLEVAEVRPACGRLEHVLLVPLDLGQAVLDCSEAFRDLVQTHVLVEPPVQLAQLAGGLFEALGELRSSEW